MASDFTYTSPLPASQPSSSLSRYRSVRKSQHHAQAPPSALPPPMPPLPDPQPQQPAQSATLGRSTSRYHRARPTTSKGALPPPPPPPIQSPPMSAGARTRALSGAQGKQQAQQYQQQQQQQRQVRQQQLEEQMWKQTQAKKHEALPRRATRDPAQATAAAQAPPTAAAKAPGAQKTPSNARAGKAHRGHADQGGLSPRQEARWVLDNEAERQRKMKAQIRNEKRARLEAEERERAAKEEEERLEQERIEAERREQEERERQRREAVEREKEERRREEERQKEERRKEREREKREREEERQRRHQERAKAEQERRAKRSSGSGGADYGNLDESSSPKAAGMLGMFKKKESPRGGPMAQGPIIAGGGGAVPGMDAPISAVNAGDRRVTVVCNDSSINLPVTPTTTPQDLIRSAATCLSESVDTNSAILLESFTKVGVTRPLRKYEHVRDAMNSWDDDTQNSLVLVASTTGDATRELSAGAVPAEKPAGATFTMYYSQRPGKWDKRFVTLRGDGQMVQAKNDSGKDTTNVCHLSDFDIYTPTPKQASKKIRPPKKICFAIKSQQKASMFMTTTNFVHFFCTGDRTTSTAFYGAVQGWRSWYLVNVMGEGQKKSPAKPSAGPLDKIDLVENNDDSSTRHPIADSMDSHYQLGSFKPLIDLNQFSLDLDSALSPSTSADTPSAADTRAMHSRKMSSRNKAPPPVSFPSRMSREPDQPTNARRPSTTDDEDTFAPTSLLGRTYSQRQKMAREREAAAKASGPFTDGPSLLKLSPIDSANEPARLGRSSSVRSTNHRRTSSDVARNPSSATPKMQKPKPLVDLTPVFREPPQHARKGKGYVPDAPSAGGLVESATSPENPFPNGPPPATDWRRPSTAAAAAAGSGFGGGMLDRSRSVRGHGPAAAAAALASGGPLAHAATNRDPHALPESLADAFTGRGLLGGGEGPGGFGARDTGQGVMSGANATGPMLDLSEGSRFAPGSLLRRVETGEGPRAPVIDREKRMTVEMGTGEGIN